MSDRIEDRLRSALRDMPLPEAPETLRRALEAVPGQGPGARHVRRTAIWRRLAVLGLAAGFLVAIGGGIVLIGMTHVPAVPGISVVPGASGSPTASTPAEPPGSVAVLDPAQLAAEIAAQRAGGLAPETVVTVVGIDPARTPDPTTRECSPQGSCRVIGVLVGFEDPVGTVTIRVDDQAVPPPTAAADLAGPVALRLAGSAPIEYLGRVDLAAGSGRLDVSGLLAATATATPGRVVAVDGWLVGIEAFPSCGPYQDPPLVPPFSCPPNRSLLAAMPVKPLTRTGNEVIGRRARTVRSKSSGAPTGSSPRTRRTTAPTTSRAMASTSSAWSPSTTPAARPAAAGWWSGGSTQPRAWLLPPRHHRAP